MENNPYNNYPGDFRRHNNYHHPRHLPPCHALPPRHPSHIQPQHLHQAPNVTQPFFNPPHMQTRYYPPAQQFRMAPCVPLMPGNQLWDRDYNSATSVGFSPGTSLVPTNVQLSPRSQAFVAENNDILLKRKGDRFLRRSRSKSWSRSPSPHGRTASSFKNGRRFSPRKRSLSNSSGESPKKYGRKHNRQHSPKSSLEDQKKDTQNQPKRRGGSPISFNLDGKKESQSKEPAAQKITLNRNRIIKLNSSNSNNSSRSTWNRNTNSRGQTSNVCKTKEDERKEEKLQNNENKNVESVQASGTVRTVEPKKPAAPVVKTQRVKTAEELLEDELLKSDDELDDGLVLTNDIDDIDDLFESESESENEGRFKSKSTTSKDSPLSFSKLGEKSIAKIRPLNDVIDKSGNKSRGYDKGNRSANNSRKSAQNDKKAERKPLEFRKLALDRKKNYGEVSIVLLLGSE